VEQGLVNIVGDNNGERRHHVGKHQADGVVIYMVLRGAISFRTRAPRVCAARYGACTAALGWKEGGKGKMRVLGGVAGRGGSRRLRRDADITGSHRLSSLRSKAISLN
jgi:hypothetical protein